MDDANGKILDVDTISLDNIDILFEWRPEYKAPVMQEAPTWLEEEEEEEHQQAHRTRHEQQECGLEEDFLHH